MAPNAHANSDAAKPRRYGGMPENERRNRRREKLIAAGYDLFGTKGFNNTKVEQVCATAGVGIRSLYDEFGSLEGLFHAVYDDVVSLAYEAFAQSLLPSGDETAGVLLERGIGTYLQQMLNNTRSGRIVSIESSRLDSFLGGHRNKTLKKFARLVASVPPQDASAFDGDVRTWSLMLAGGLNEVVIDAVLAKRKPDIAALTASIARIYARTL